MFATLFIGIILFYPQVQGFYLKKRIPGPESVNSRIAIVGAGPAGIHMGLLMKEKGFKNIDIYEKESEIGGKSNSIFKRGVFHELGTCYLSSDYQDAIMPLVARYNKTLKSLPLASIYLDRYSFPISFQAFAAMFGMEVLKTNNSTVALIELKKEVNKYNHLHHSLFGAYDGGFMPEPNNTVMQLIDGTFSEYLNRNNMSTLSSLFFIAHTMQGYGQLDEIPAFYGLLWNTPSLLSSVLKRMENTGAEGLYSLEEGFQSLWSSIVEKENLTIISNEVVQLIRQNNNNSTIGYNSSGIVKWKTYNFVIWSPEMSTSLIKWSDTFEEERQIFNKTKVQYFTTSIVDVYDMKRGSSPITYWLDNLRNKTTNKVWALRDSYASLNGYSGINYQNNALPNGDDQGNHTTGIAYQMSDTMQTTVTLRSAATKTFTDVGSTKVEIDKMKTWRYFPRYSNQDIKDSIFWKILKMQGKYGMWYIGSSVSFESVKSVVEYNNLLLKNWDVPVNSGMFLSLSYLVIFCSLICVLCI